jgi:hypothetical protein
VLKERIGRRLGDATSDTYVVTTPEQRKVVDANNAYDADIKQRVAAGEGKVFFGWFYGN